MLNLAEKFTPEAVEATEDDGIVAIEYVVMAGEFPIVNGQPQRGLVRFATRPTSPGRDGPR